MVHWAGTVARVDWNYWHWKQNRKSTENCKIPRLANWTAWANWDYLKFGPHLWVLLTVYSVLVCALLSFLWSGTGKGTLGFQDLWVQAAGINETFFLKSLPVLGTNGNFKPVIKTVYRLTITYVRMNENGTSSWSQFYSNSGEKVSHRTCSKYYVLKNIKTGKKE